MRTLEVIDINIPGCELELKMDSHDIAEAGHGVQSPLEAEQLSQVAIFFFIKLIKTASEVLGDNHKILFQ